MSTTITGSKLNPLDKSTEIDKKVVKAPDSKVIPEVKPQIKPEKDKLIDSKLGSGKVNPNLSFQDNSDKDKIRNQVPKIAKGVVIAAAVQVSKTSAEVVTTKAIEAAVKKGTVKAGEKIAVAAGKKVAATAAEKASAITIKAIGKSVGINVGLTAVATVVEEVAIKAVENTGKKVAVKTGEKAASRWAACVPVVGAVIEAGFMAYDAKYAYDLSKDPKVSKLSKALAWGTVGLDAVSMVTTATGVGSVIGWVATGLSVVTGVASDLTQ